MRSATIAAHDNLHDNQDPPVVPGGKFKPAFEGDGGSGSLTGWEGVIHLGPREPSMLLDGSAREDTGEGPWKNPALLKEFACRFVGLLKWTQPIIQRIKD